MYEQLCLWEDYEPEVDDYVIWNKYGNKENNDEGWVYFKCEEYITIETGVKPRPDAECEGSRHKFIHTLLLCNKEYWHELTCIKRRESTHIQHYSQYDDRT